LAGAKDVKFTPGARQEFIAQFKVHNCPISARIRPIPRRVTAAGPD
jgi:hypothetical protein